MELRNILVATDFSDDAERALEAGIRLAGGFEAELHLMHALDVPLPVFEPFTVAMPERYLGDFRKVAQEKLEAAFERARERGVDGTIHLGQVPAAHAIADRAREVEADLAVVGSHGHTGLSRFLLGSVAEGTVKHAPCSVLTVREGRDEGPRCIVAATDFSDAAAFAVHSARELAERFQTDLHLVHALSLPTPWVSTYEISVPTDLFDSTYRRAKERLEKLAEECEIAGEVTTDLVSASPPMAIVSAAEKHDARLVVTGSHGRKGVEHFVLGSVAERTLRHVPCSVWTARPRKA